MNIDTATGLPELPEGYFWRINPWYVEIRKNEPDTIDPELSVRTWWGGKKILRKEQVISGNTRRVCIGALARNPDHPAPSPGVWGMVDIVNAVPVTKKNVLEMAERAMAEYDRLDLFGDYPPKKLEA